MNERKTEDLVSERLRNRSYFRKNNGVVVEKQQSDSPRIQHLLENASKKGTGVGRPEFIIHSDEVSDFLIVIECKASTTKHISDSLDHYADYAVDGVLLYASFLAKQFDVLAIAVSGQTESKFRISHYLHLKGTLKAVEYTEATDIQSFSDYYTGFLQSGIKFKQDYETLLDYSRTLNGNLHEKKIKEAHRGLLISGILIALQNRAFKDSFKSHKTAKQISLGLVATIESEFESAKLPQEKRTILKQAFSFITTAPTLNNDKEFFVGLIEGVDNNINAFMRTHKYYDTVGQFYIEFLRYANNDKGLGIVLTPPHIAELFAEIVEINKNSRVFDNCCGTAGLLIAAMKVMIRDAKSDEALKSRIRSKQLFGIEYQDDIYALAVSNMILHGDGKTNIYQGDCFSHSKKIVPKKPTVGILNPPYRTDKNDKEEFEFVFNNLETIAPNGKCIAIVPITCATAPSGEMFEWKTKILQKHTLEAVMSMPISLFHNSKVGVVTCSMVFTAHRPHPIGKKTWFGYWRDDGFVKTKHRGRVDLNGTWDEIKKKWLDAYRNREVINGFSLMKEVRAQDEWCAEAYMVTDYETVTPSKLEEALKKYFLSNVMTMHEIRAGKVDDEAN
jgi:type I restriction-modification system DNA methylase subunit